MVVRPDSPDVPVRCGCIVFDKDTRHILLVHNKDKWGLPKGHREHNEHLVACAKRELLEETGIDVMFPQHVSCVTLPYNALYYVIRVEKDICKTHKRPFDKEITEVQWFRTDQLRHEDLKCNTGLRSAIHMLPHLMKMAELCPVIQNMNESWR